MTTPPKRERRRVITLRVEPALKHRIHTTARQQGLSEAAAVLRAVRSVFRDDMLPPFRSPEVARDPATDRLTVRLRPRATVSRCVPVRGHDGINRRVLFDT